MVQTMSPTGDFQWAMYKKVAKYTMYICTLGYKHYKLFKNLHVLMVPWYIKVQMMSLKNMCVIMSICKR